MVDLAGGDVEEAPSSVIAIARRKMFFIFQEYPFHSQISICKVRFTQCKVRFTCWIVALFTSFLAHLLQRGRCTGSNFDGSQETLCSRTFCVKAR